MTEFYRRRWRLRNAEHQVRNEERRKVQAAESENKAEKSALKTNLKKFDAAVAEGNRDAAVSTYKVAVQAVDRAAGKGLIHKNNAAHKKSAMAQKMNELG